VTGSSGSRTGTPSAPVRHDRPGEVSARAAGPGSSAPPSCSEEARRVKAAVLAGQQDEARAAFADLVAMYQRQAMRLALYLLRDGAEADEAVQDTFVKVYTHITSYREDLPFEAWFTRILANTCRDRQKAKRRRARWETIGFERADQPGSAADLAQAPGPSPEDALLGSERRRELMSAIDTLPRRQRDILLLCHVEGQSPREVGEMTGLTESTVRVHLFRALRKLRGALEVGRVRR
jgi:RNA polymerase sigma-70 factor (ECF subfamily)